MLRRFFLIGAIACVIVGFSCRRETEDVSEQRVVKSPKRILSIIPSVTETLFALGLGDRVVGVSDFCRWPPEARNLPKTGGLLNPNVERMVELAPDIVVLLPDHSGLQERLGKFGIETLLVDHSSIPGILDSFETIGQRFGQESLRRGRELRADYERRITELRRETEAFPPVPVMISIDRVRGNGKITQVYVAGDNPYFNEILTLAGGVNVFANSTAVVPTVSREGILEKNPEVIFDFSTDGVYSEETQLTDELQEIYRTDWNSLGDSVAAVKNGRVYPVLADYATVPGPRFILLVETLTKLLHHERVRDPF